MSEVITPDAILDYLKNDDPAYQARRQTQQGFENLGRFYTPEPPKFSTWQIIAIRAVVFACAFAAGYFGTKLAMALWLISPWYVIAPLVAVYFIYTVTR